MNGLLFGALSFGLLGAAMTAAPDVLAPETPVVEAVADSSPPVQVEQAHVQTISMRADTQAAKDAADDAEFQRLMEAAPDVGTFGDSVIVDAETGVETHVSGIGFQDN